MRLRSAVVPSIICTILSVACSHAPDPAVSANLAETSEDTHCEGDTPSPGAVVEDVSATGAPSRGASAEAAAITVVEFADYQCSYCTKAEATVHALEAAHPGKVRVVFKNMPLPMHDHARLLAKAALAADGQKDFWTMHDRLFASVDAAPSDRAGLIRLAGELGLDTARFARDLDGTALDAKIDADVAEGKALGVEGTPTFFVNGRRVTGAQPLATFESAAIPRSP